MKDTTAPPVSKHIIYALIVCIFIGGAWLVHRTIITPRLKEDTVTQEKKVIEPSYTGVFTLIPAHDKNIFKIGEDVELILYADSKGQPVVGYDLLLNVSPDEVSLKDVQSLKDGFGVTFKPQKESISITGLRDLQFDGDSILRNEPIAQLIFTTSKSGRIDFPIAFELGQTRDSNLVVDTQDILGEVTPTFIYVSDATSVRMKRRDRIHLTNGFELQLDSITPPDPQCADCTTTAAFRFISGDVELDDQIEVQLGGIAGSQWKEFEGRGHRIAVKDIDDTTLEVIAIPLE